MRENADAPSAQLLAHARAIKVEISRRFPQCEAKRPKTSAEKRAQRSAEHEVFRMRAIKKLSAVAMALTLGACATNNEDMALMSANDSVSLTAPRYGAGKGTGLTIAQDAIRPDDTADTMMVSLMTRASKIASPEPDMRSYARCVGISDYMTAYSTADDRGDWDKDSRKLEATASKMDDFDAELFASDREITQFKMAELLRSIRMDPTANVTISRKTALAHDIAACVALSA